MSIDYSVVIRTTGKAHEKYRALLDSIQNLNDRPREVIVVLPEGYSLPDEQLGWERFCFSPKGMTIQRLKGLSECRTAYALFCDDDIRFGKDFVRQLYEPLKEGKASFSAAPLYSFLPPEGANALFCTINASAMPTVFHKKDRYISVLKSSGYSYNRHLENDHDYETQSLPWTCFFADVQAFSDLHMEDEKWLDSHGYASLDDQTMFYKAWLMGFRTVVLSTASYEHLDAMTSRRNNALPKIYSMGFNRVVFWHRFIYSMQNHAYEKILAKSAFAYRRMWIRLWEMISVKRGKMKQEEYETMMNGLKDGFEYLKSAEYQALPPVIRKDQERSGRI